MFAVLGDIEFELITYWDGFEATFGVDYAEHARIEGKPGLQFIGDRLDEIQISLVFHQHWRARRRAGPPENCNEGPSGAGAGLWQR